jgi:hypothetical protein
MTTREQKRCEKRLLAAGADDVHLVKREREPGAILTPDSHGISCEVPVGTRRRHLILWNVADVDAILERACEAR